MIWDLLVYIYNYLYVVIQQEIRDRNNKQEERKMNLAENVIHIFQLKQPLTGERNKKTTNNQHHWRLINILSVILEAPS